MNHAEIEALIAAATPGPWTLDTPGLFWGTFHACGNPEPVDFGMTGQENLDLVLAAPAALRWLLDENARLEKQREADKSALVEEMKQRGSLLRRIRALETALQPFADLHTYSEAEERKGYRIHVEAKPILDARRVLNSPTPTKE